MPDKTEISQNYRAVHVMGTWDIAVEDGMVKIGSLFVYSDDLSYLLREHKQAVILAATLGVRADAYIYKTMHMSAACGMMADEEASQFIERYVNRLQSDFVESGKRFSPGYGDFDIRHQADILKMLNAGRIGLYLTDAFMLAPSKSITAVFGI